MGYVQNAAGEWVRAKGKRATGWSGDSGIYLRYRENVAVNALFAQAAERALAESVVALGRAYQAAVPAQRVARSVQVAVRPPRAYVGPSDFRANFFEAGAKQHRIESRGVRLKKRRYKAYTKIIGFQKGIRYLAIPVGGKAIFRSTANHPGMQGGRYMRRVGEQGVAVVQQIVSRAFQAVFS